MQSHSDSIDGEIKSVTKNSIGLLVYWGYWGSILRILKFPKLNVTKNSNTFLFHR